MSNPTDIVRATGQAGRALNQMSDQDLLLDAVDMRAGAADPKEYQLTDSEILLQSIDPSQVIEEDDDEQAVQLGQKRNPLEMGLVYQFDEQGGVTLVPESEAKPNEVIRQIQHGINNRIQAIQREQNRTQTEFDTLFPDPNGIYNLETLQRLNQARKIVGMEGDVDPSETGVLFGTNPEDQAKFLEVGVGNTSNLESLRPVGGDWTYHPAVIEGNINKILDALTAQELEELGTTEAQLGEDAYDALRLEISKGLDVYRVAGAGNWTNLALKAKKAVESGTATNMDHVVYTVGRKLIPIQKRLMTKNRLMTTHCCLELNNGC